MNKYKITMVSGKVYKLQSDAKDVASFERMISKNKYIEIDEGLLVRILYIESIGVIK